MADQQQATLVRRFGHFGIYSPYESHDGSVGYTVQLMDDPTDADAMGDILGEFAKVEDAELFADVKYRRAMAHAL